MPLFLSILFKNDKFETNNFIEEMILYHHSITTKIKNPLFKGFICYWRRT